LRDVRCDAAGGAVGRRIGSGANCGHATGCGSTGYRSNVRPCRRACIVVRGCAFRSRTTAQCCGSSNFFARTRTCSATCARHQRAFVSGAE